MLLWERRTVLQLPDGTLWDLLSLPDLVRAKKTQRDKDWPMIRRLVEAHYFENSADPTPVQVNFWLQELPTPELVLEASSRYREIHRSLLDVRPLLAFCENVDTEGSQRALVEEEVSERNLDREYWRPLRKELEELRHRR